MKIIDTHSQLWIKEAIERTPLEMFGPYADVFKGLKDIKTALEKFASAFTVETIIKDMDAAGVTMAVVVGIDAETTYNYKIPNELVAETVKKYPDRLIGFAGVDPRKGQIAVRELEHAIQDLELKGVKLLPHLMELFPNDPICYPIYEKAEELGVPVLFHTGNQFHRGTRLKYCRPLYLDDVAVDFPKLKIIIAHFGWPWTEETLALALRHPNVYFNIAGWAPKYLPEVLLRYMDGPLKNKALFGTDYPLLPRKRVVSEFMALPLKEETKRKVLYENPRKVLDLDI
ncbi:MAG: amidohydrolase family protein [Candidatus Baldrarchaeia archaeon]